MNRIVAVPAGIPRLYRWTETGVGRGRGQVDRQNVQNLREQGRGWGLNGPSPGVMRFNPRTRHNACTPPLTSATPFLFSLSIYMAHLIIHGETEVMGPTCWRASRRCQRTRQRMQCHPLLAPAKPCSPCTQTTFNVSPNIDSSQICAWLPTPCLLSMMQL